MPSPKTARKPKRNPRATPASIAARLGSQQQQPQPAPPNSPVSPSEQHETIEKARRRLTAADTRQQKALLVYHATLPSAPQFKAATAELHEATRSLIYARAAYGEVCANI